MTMTNAILSKSDNVPCQTISQWSKLASETEDDFIRFECYRQSDATGGMGSRGGRSIGKAYRAYILLRYGQEEYDRRKSGSRYALTSYPVQWSNMAKRNRWLERASAFDAHQHDLDMAIENEERDRCRQLRKDALHQLLTASTDALASIDLSESNLAQASTAIRTAVRELRTEYHDHDAQVEVNAILAVIPDNLRQGILAMLQVRTTSTLTPGHTPSNIIDNNDTNDNNDNNDVNDT